jgi:hypothetical protein
VWQFVDISHVAQRRRGKSKVAGKHGEDLWHDESGVNDRLGLPQPPHSRPDLVLGDLVWAQHHETKCDRNAETFIHEFCLVRRPSP